MCGFVPYFADPDKSLSVTVSFMPASNYALLFDLDGTLVDSAIDLQFATNVILTQEGFAPLSREDIEHCLGDGLQKLLEKAFARAGHNLSEEDVKRLMPDFADAYAHLKPQTTAYPGVVDFLKAQKARGVKLGLCTNKYESATHKVLKDLGLDEFFSTIVGGDTVSTCKPHPLPLQHALKQLNADPANALMLGDHINDVLSARGAGIKVIGANYGYTKEWPKDAMPDAFIQSFSEYDAAARKLLNGF
jgi:phosphoglycolate phosphatase